MTSNDEELNRLRARLAAFDRAWSISLASDSIHDVRNEMYLLVKQTCDQYYTMLGLDTKETTNV